MTKPKFSVIKNINPKNDSATSPVPELLTQNALKRKLCDSPKKDSPSNILDLVIFVWLVIHVVYGFTTNVLGFQDKNK